MQRILTKKYFLFTLGSVCLVKRVTTGSRNCHLGGKRFADYKEVYNGDAEVAETTVKRILCCGFRRTGKAMGQVF
jgi:hypothetical protein